MRRSGGRGGVATVRFPALGLLAVTLGGCRLPGYANWAPRQSGQELRMERRVRDLAAVIMAWARDHRDPVNERNVFERGSQLRPMVWPPMHKRNRRRWRNRLLNGGAVVYRAVMSRDERSAPR